MYELLGFMGAIGLQLAVVAFYIGLILTFAYIVQRFILRKHVQK